MPVENKINNPLTAFYLTGNWMFYKTGIFKLMVIIGILLLSGCEKEKETKPIFETGTVKDIDGNVYETVKIGHQWWMASDLIVQHYCNGDSIAQIAGNLVNGEFILDNWETLEEGACYNNNIGKFKNILYNWYAVTDPREIAPPGWHIPSDEDWKELEIYLGMSRSEVDKVSWRGNKEGNKLRLQERVGSKKWNYSINIYEIYGTNESGFSALPSGCVMFNGTYSDNQFINSTATEFWWSVTPEGNKVWYRYLDYNKGGIFRFYGPKTYGFSVRCIKDKVVGE